MKFSNCRSVLAALVASTLLAGKASAGDGLTDRITSVYQTPHVPAVAFTNSPRLGDLIRAGRLYLSLDDAVALAIENNLDIEYQRFNLDTARYELVRAQGGGVTRGLTLIVSEAPSGVGGPAAPLVTSPASRTAPGSTIATNPVELGGLGQVQSNLSITGQVVPSLGTPVPTFDPSLTGVFQFQHQSAPQSNVVVSGAENLISRSIVASAGLRQGYSSGLQINGSFANSFQDVNSIRNSINPFATSSLGLNFTQPLLRGFGFSVNRRYINIARNENRIADALLRQQLIASVYGVTRLYYDLVALYQDVLVKEETLRFNDRLLADTRAAFEQGTAAEVEVARANAQLFSARQDLERSRGLFEEQTAVLKTYLSRRGISDPLLQTAQIVPTSANTDIPVPTTDLATPVDDLVQQAMSNRGDLAVGQLQVENLNLNFEGVRSALKPQLDLIGTAQNVGLGGSANPLSLNPGGSFTGGYGSAIEQVFRRNYPVYGVGIQLDLPLRNRVAQADAARDQVLIRQSEIRLQQLRNQVRLEVEDALISMRRARTAWEAAVEARKLQERSLEIEQARYAAGVSTSFFVLQYQSLLAQARSSEVVSRSAYVKAQAALGRATGSILSDRGVSITDAGSHR